MADKPVHHRDRWALRSLQLRDDGLVEHRWRGDRFVPWLDVHGVRWVSPGVAEVVVRDGQPIPLPRGGELIEEVERRASAALARWQDDGASPEQVASWLALNGRRRRRVDPSGLRLAFGLPWVLPFVMGLDPAGSAAALVVAAGLTIWSARHWKPVATLDVTGVSTRHRGERRRIAWTDLRSVTVTHRRRHSFPKVVLELSDGTTTLWFEEHLDTMASIVTCASRVAAANTVVFEPAGPEPPPDTALSPARLTEAEAERGVSRVDEVRP